MSGSGTLSLWRDGRFRLIWAGQTASILGDNVTGLALPWLVLAQTHSAFEAGLVSAARYVPLIAFGLIAGILADCVTRRNLMIACDLARACALASIVVLALARHAPPLWLLAVAVLVLGTGQLGFQVAYRAWLPDVTGDEQLSRATAALEASDASGTLIGPPLGGVLIQALGPALALGADAISYITSALTLAQVHDADTHAIRASPMSLTTNLGMLWREAFEGMRVILTSPEQRLLRGVSAALYLGAGAIELLLATLTQLRLHLPAWQAGLVFGAAGVGGLIGSALAPRIYERGWRRGLAGIFFVAAFGTLGLACASGLDARWGFMVALLSNLVLDGAVATGFILSGTAATLLTPREARGRVNAAAMMYSSLLRGASVLGMGALASRGNPLPAFLLLAACYVSAALVASIRGTWG